MASDGDIRYGLGLDISQAQAEVSKLKRELDSLTKGFVTTSTAISSQVNRMTVDLRAVILQLQAEQKNTLSAERKLASARKSTAANASETDASRAENAAIRKISNDLRTKKDAIDARIADEVVKVFSLKLRNINKAIDARMQLEIDKIERMIDSANPALLASKRNRLIRNNQRLISEEANPDLLSARDYRYDRSNKRLINEYKDTDLQTAKIAQETQRNNRLKERFLDLDRVNLEQKLSEIALDSKRRRAMGYNPEALDAAQQRRARQQRNLIEDENNADLLEAQEYKRRLRNRRTINDYKDDDLRTAKIAQEQEANNRLKEQYLDLENVNLRKLTQQQQLRVKTFNAETFDERFDRRRRNLEKLREREAAEASDVGLLQAKNNEKALRNELKKQLFNDQEYLDLVRQEAAQRLTSKRERVATFEARRLERQEAEARRLARKAEEANKAEETADEARLRRAKERIRSYNEQRTLQRASNIDRYGQPTKPVENEQHSTTYEKTMERMRHNGGADILAIRAQALIDYQTVASTFNMLMSMGQFITQLDNEFKNFQAITATTNSEMVGLKEQLIGVSEASKFTALEIAQAATVMGQAGLSAKTVGETIGSVSLLATAAGTDLNSAVDVVTSTMSIFNLQNSQAADIANTMTGALNESKLTLEQVTLALQYSGNIADQTGISYKELLATIGAMANSGIRSGSTLGTGLRQLLTDIQNPTKKFLEILKQLKLSQKDVDVASRGLVPVLKSLQEAGFTTGQAFESFEVRAASAYAALSNNIDLIGKMQESFVLSNAATEANRVQMESLQNTYAKFTSSFNTVAATAFEPTVRALQKLFDALANLMIGIRQYPNLLKVLGTAISAVGFVLVTNRIMALFKASGILIGGFQGMVGTLSSVSASLLGYTAVTNRAAAATGALNLAARLNPWIMLATAVAAGITMMGGFASASESARDKIDDLKGQVNEFQGDVDNTKQEISSMDDTMKTLVQQKAELDKDPVMRRAKIFEVISSFKELAGSVDVSTASVKDLIEALNRLKDEKIRLNIGQLGQQQLAQQDLIKGVKETLTARENAGNPFESLASDRLLTSYNAPSEQINKALSAYLGGGLLKALNFASAPMSNMPKQSDELFTYQNAVKERLNAYSDEMKALERVQKVNPTLSGRDRLERLNSMIEALKVIDQNLGEVSASAFEIFKGEIDTEATKSERRARQIQVMAGYKELERKATEAQEAFTQRSQDITKNNKGIDALLPLQKLKKDFDATMQSLHDEAAVFAAGAAEALGEGTDRDQARNVARQAVDNMLLTVQTSIGQAYTSVTEKSAKLIEKKTAKNDQTLAKYVEGLMTRARRSSDIDDVDLVRNSVMSIMDARRKLLDEVFAAKTEATTDDFERQELVVEHKEALDKLAEEERQMMETLNERVKAITDDYLQWREKSLESTISDLKKRISDSTDRLAKLNPGKAFDALNASINSMIDELGRLQGEASGVTSQRDTIAGRRTYIPYGSASNNMLDLIAYAEGTGNDYNATLGYGKFTGGPVDLVNMNLKEVLALQKRMLAHPENTFNSSAVGRYQIVSTTLKSLMQEMGLTGNEKFSPILQNEMARRLLARRGNDVDGLRNEWEGLRKIDGGVITRAAGGMGFDSPEVTAAKQEQADAAKAAGIKEIKAVTNSIVQQSTQQIEALTAQAKINSDPEAIRKLIGSVDAKYKEIVDAKTKAFDAKNADALKEEDPETLMERDQLLSGLTADRNQKITALFEQYQRAAEEAANKAIESARMALEEAQRPENSGKYTSTDIAKLEDNVRIAERKAQIDQLHGAEQALLMVRQQLAATQVGSEDHTYWLTQEAELKQRLVDLTNQKAVADEASTRAQYSVSDAVQAANQNYMVQIGLMQRIPGEGLKMVPLAQQVGDAWSQVLPQLTDAFSNLFTNLASGSMSALDALKKFGQDVINIFMQIIARKLAEQLMASLIPSGGGGGGGFFSTLFSGLFGIPGQANGGVVRGAAVGEVINGPISTRDSVLRRVQPGEVILRQSAAKAIGYDTLNAMNNLGNRRISASPNNDNNQQNGGGVVNVWVVSPDQKPSSMGPNDVIATVADNIQRRGTIKQLIKQVQMGSV